MIEEGEIVEHHSPLGTPSSLNSKGLKGQMSLDYDTHERLCTPLRIMKASPTKIAKRVMTSLDKVEAEKELSPSSPQVDDNGGTKCRDKWYN